MSNRERLSQLSKLNGGGGGGAIPTTASTIKRLQTELTAITQDPPPLCSASPKGDSITEWVATIIGPPESVYEGGIFFLNVTFPHGYPFKPPEVKFKTRIYHCNINSTGTICLDILKDNWSPAYSLSTVLLSIVALLLNCTPQDPIVGAIGAQYVQDREEHDRIARLWTQKFAT